MAGEIHPKPTSLYSHRFQCSLSILEQPEVFAPWWIGEHRQAAPLWRDEDETPNSLLSCLQPCRLLEDFSIKDRAGKPS